MELNSLVVTGGDGQVGRAFRELVPAAVTLTRRQLDVTSEESIAANFELYEPSIVVNAAAFTKVDAAESEIPAATAINAAGPHLLADACNRAGAKLVQISTDYVFDGTKTEPYAESDIPSPRSVYGRTKLEGERAASKAADHLVVRTSWVFGDGTNFVRSIIAIGSSREEVGVVDDQIGRPTYARDLAGGILQLLRQDALGLFHLSNQGEPASWADIAEMALAVSGVECTVRRVSTSEYYAGRTEPIAPRPANSVLDCSKAESQGVRLRDWREALADYLG